jgi:hypothetical protein
MDTLAFVHASIAYEEPNSSYDIEKFKDTKLRGVSSAAMAFVASGIVTTTLAYTNQAQAALYYGSKGSEVAKLQTALGNIAVDGVFGSETLARLKFYQDKHRLRVDGIAGSATLSRLGLSNSLHNLVDQPVSVQEKQRKPEQYGRLYLINDTPYMAVVSLYMPGEKEPCRYAYIPPYTDRTLLDTYSSSWKISFNKHGEFLIKDLLGEKTAYKEHGLFKVKLSSLNNDDKEYSEYKISKSLKAELVNYDIVGRPFYPNLHESANILKGFLSGVIKEEEFVASRASIVDKFSFKLDSLKQTFNNIGNAEDITALTEDSKKESQYLSSLILSQNGNKSSDFHPILLSNLEQRVKQRVDFNGISTNDKLSKDKVDEINKAIEEVWTQLRKECPELHTTSVETLSPKSLFALRSLFIGNHEIENQVQFNGLSSRLSPPPVNTSSPTESLNVVVKQKLANCPGIALANRKDSGLIFANFSTQSRRIAKKCI